MKDPEFVQQIEKLRTHTSEIRERDIVVVPVISHEAIRSHLPPDLPSAELSQSEVAAVTSRFKVSSDSFRVILVGKDGNQKLSRKAPVSFGELSTLIDSMPMRKQEIMRRSQDRKLQ